MTSTLAAANDALNQAQIRRLVMQKQILPLESILAGYPPARHSKLLDLEVEQEHGQIVYELEFLQPDGKVVKVVIDARNGQVHHKEED
jgi:uncharacterized membrane protein YkoI